MHVVVVPNVIPFANTRTFSNVVPIQSRKPSDFDKAPYPDMGDHSQLMTTQPAQASTHTYAVNKLTTTEQHGKHKPQKPRNTA